MHELLPIDIALWSALIIAAALIIIRRRRRHSRMPTDTPRRDAAERGSPRRDAGEHGSPRRDAVEQGGLHRDATEQARPRRDAAEQAGQKMPPRTTALATSNGEGPSQPRRPAPRPAGAAPTAPQAAEANGGPRRPATQRAGRQAPARTAAPSEPIARYYDQADQPIADYLAALGWAQESPAPPGRATGADGDSAAEPPGGSPAP